MLTYNEQIELRNKLMNGSIELSQAKELFWKDFKEGERSWHSEDWKERRATVIKDKCEICSSTEILTIQHLSHPKKYSEYRTEITRAFAQGSIDSNPEIDRGEYERYIHRNYEYLPIPLCRECGGRNPSKRVRKLPQYRCTECRHEFDKPIYKTVDELISIFYENEDAIEFRDKCFITKDKYRNKHNLSNIKYWLQREKAKNQNGEAIEKKAFLLYLDDNIKYLSFEDTITACKKCASNFDLHHLDLCPKCKEYYKGIQYPTCIQCLPEDRQKIALESIEFGKQWRGLENELGID